MDHDGDGDIGTTPTPIPTQQEKPARPPPVYIIKAKLNDITNLLTEGNIQKNEFLKNQSTHDSLSISARTMPLYRKIIEILKNKGALYYTFTPKNLRPKTLVLKGIHGNFKEEILKEIKELNILNTEVIKVSRFQFDKNQPEKSHHLVQLSNNSKLSDIFKITSLAYQRVKWEHLKKPKLFQCRRCQRVGHASNNCNLPYRCVKCAQNHEINHADKAALKCANRGNTGHPASYKGCPYLKFASDLIK